MERVAVKSLRIGVGMNEHGQIVQVNHAANQLKKLFVVSGKFARIEMTHAETNALTIAEVPLGPFGWEYEVL